MKVETNLKELKKLFSNISKKGELQTHLSLTAFKNSFRILIGDGNAMFEATIPATVYQEGDVVVWCGDFKSIITRFTGNTVIIEKVIGSECARLQFTTENAQSTISYNLDTELVFPSKIKDYFKINGNVLKEALKKVIFVADIKHDRTYGMYCYFKSKPDNTLELVATDGRRIAVTTTNCELLENFEFTIPKKDINTLNKLLSNNEITCSLHEYISDYRGSIKYIRFQISNIRLVIRQEEFEYPSYQTVLDDVKPTYYVTVNRKQFYDAMNGALTIQKNQTDIPKVYLTQDDDNKITIKTPEQYYFEANIQAKTIGQPIPLAFNPKYLTEVLNVINSDEITLEIRGSDKSIRLQDANLVYVFMPIRL